MERDAEGRFPSRLNGRRTLLYLAPNRWEGSRQRTQHLAAGLAQTRPVIFVEPAAYSLPGMLRRRLAGGPVGPLRGGVRQISPHLLVYTPPSTLPGSLHLRSLNRLVHRLAWPRLHRLLRHLDTAEMDVVVGWPPALDLARWLRPRRLIYDCLDLFPAFDPGLRRRLMERLEAELAETAWAIVVTSRWLERLWAERHSRVVRIPNGVEVARFLPAPEPWPEPADLTLLPCPRIGYIGTVGRWLDLSLLGHLASQRPDCSIILVGPLERGVAQPVGQANVYLLGQRPYSDLPAYLAAMDVLLIPFRLIALTQAVNPIKLYEYCASGKPIAATPLEEVAAAGDLCHLGDGPEGFLAAVAAALAEATHPDPARIATRQALARASSWDHRVAAFSALLDESD